MSSLKTLLLAVELATRQRDGANHALAEQQQVLLQGQQQLQQLETYARETETRWELHGQRSTTPELMNHHYQFMGRLSQAMDMQGSVLREQQARVEQARLVLVQAEQRLASFQKVCEKRRADLAREQRRREQREVDEMAARQHRAASENHYFGRGQS
jgi:flagellar protein FliJ